MSFKILIDGSMEFNEVLRNDGKEQLSLLFTIVHSNGRPFV